MMISTCAERRGSHEQRLAQNKLAGLLRVCVCVCVREKERERERVAIESDRQYEGYQNIYHALLLHL